MLRLKRKLSLISALVILSLGVFLLIIIIAAKDLPDPEFFDTRQIIQSTKIFDRTDKILLYEVYGEEKRTIIPFSEIPDNVKHATISIEDVDFYNHHAFDWRSIARALLTNIRHGRIVQGGSTITQQLAKNVFLSPERTLLRKIKELVLAFQLEKRYTKDKIIDLYLNQIPYGSNAYGIEAAAQTFFNKSAKDLTLAQAALLTSLPKAPSYYSPYGAHVDALMDRKNLILDRMQQLGYITEKEKMTARKEKIEFVPQLQSIKAPHFIQTVMEYLNNRYGEDIVRTAGLHVITTLDWELQQRAEVVVAEGATRNTELYQGHNAALVAQDPTTGQIVALVGSKDYFNIEEEGNFNVATQGLRQPGSAIKPFAYVTAFQKGYTPDTVVFDVETDFDTTGEESYIPHNFDNLFRGPVTMRNGLAQSINVPSVKTLYLATIPQTLKTAHDFGITTLIEKSRYGLSLALGGGEVKLIDLVGAYSVFSQEGVKHNQSFVLKVTDSKNTVLEEYKDTSARVIDAQYPQIINDILSDAEARRPLFQNSFGLTIYSGYDVALKTGTTNDYRDAWAIGYTPSLVAGVWAGNNNNEPMQRKGGSILAAVPIWNAFMKDAIQKTPRASFTRPEPIYTNKPILNGQYVINGQVHDVLHYVSRNNPQGEVPTNPSSDPQYEQWEKGVIAWLQQNPSALTANAITSASLNINLTTPTNGSFVDAPITINAALQSPRPINKIEIYFNNNLVDQKISDFGTTYQYQNTIQPTLDIQNLFKIKIYIASGESAEKEVILYRK